MYFWSCTTFVILFVAPLATHHALGGLGVFLTILILMMLGRSLMRHNGELHRLTEAELQQLMTKRRVGQSDLHPLVPSVQHVTGKHSPKSVFFAHSTTGGSTGHHAPIASPTMDAQPLVSVPSDTSSPPAPLDEHRFTFKVVDLTPDTVKSTGSDTMDALQANAGGVPHIVDAASHAKPHSLLGGVPVVRPAFQRMYNQTFNYTKNRGFDGIPTDERFYTLQSKEGTPEYAIEYEESQVKERLWNRVMDYTVPEAKREVMTWMWRGDFEFLWEMGRILPSNSVVVEVGCFQGGSIIVLSSSLVFHNKTNVSITGYDIWPGWERGYPPGVVNTQEIFDRNMQNFGFSDMVTSVRIPRDRSDTATVYKWPNASVDFVFIDDGHYYNDVMHDLTTWYRTLKPSGVLGGHDWDPIWHGQVVKAVKTFCASMMCRISPWNRQHRLRVKNSIVYGIVRDNLEEPAKSLAKDFSCFPYKPEGELPPLSHLCL